MQNSGSSRRAESGGPVSEDSDKLIEDRELASARGNAEI